MQFISRKSSLSGSVSIPGSKSHTIRAVLLASLADGESTLHAPLASQDTEAAVRVYSALGAEFDLQDDIWRIRGVGEKLRIPAERLDVANSGTTLRVALGSCSLLPPGRSLEISGDAQIQRRPGGPLVASLNELGANITSVNGTGCAPFRVEGQLKGGYTKLEAKTSQYVTSLLFCAPLAEHDTEIEVTLLHERPYVQMSLDWLRFQGIEVEHENLMRYHVKGGQRFQPFERQIPADFSTATFFLVAGALPGNRTICRGLDMNDSQSDKLVVRFLREMGATVEESEDGISVEAPNGLQGADLDLNDCPDSLPMMAVLGCFARGTTRLLNVPQARIKETDRIAVMCQELTKLGADIEELEDGLVIRQSNLRAAHVDGHEDHRVVMSLAICGTQLAGETRIETAEAAAVTCPTFREAVNALGGDLQRGE